MYEWTYSNTSSNKLKVVTVNNGALTNSHKITVTYMVTHMVMRGSPWSRVLKKYVKKLSLTALNESEVLNVASLHGDFPRYLYR